MTRMRKPRLSAREAQCLQRHGRIHSADVVIRREVGFLPRHPSIAIGYLFADEKRFLRSWTRFVVVVVVVVVVAVVVSQSISLPLTQEV